MQKYELMVMVVPQATEADSKKIISQITEVLKSFKATKIEEDFWGEKELAYKIKKLEKCVYSVITFEIDSEGAKSISKSINLIDNVVRYLLTKIEE